MNIDSPASNNSILKNIESYFGNSPDSPSLSKNIFKNKSSSKYKPKPLATKNLNTLFDLQKESKYDSPTSTLAADLSENFHIQESQKMIPTPKRSLFFNDNSTTDQFSLEVEQDMDCLSPSLIKREINKSNSSISAQPQPLRPRIQNTSSTGSSRTTSNLSISSISSISSVSSVDTISSNTTTSFIKSRKPLRRSKTSIAGASRLHSYSVSNIEFLKTFNSDDDHHNNNDLTLTNDYYESDNSTADNNLDFLCVPSPIAERSINMDLDEDENEEQYGGINKREIGSPLQKRPIRSKVRRTHSMFYSKKEITDTTNMFGNLMSKSPMGKFQYNQSTSALNNQEFDESVLSNSVLEKSKIETFNVKNDLIPRIKVETLCKILDGHYKELFDEVTIVDCRFEYEYQGGHINGALNVSSQQELEDKFLDGVIKSSNTFLGDKKNKLIVFHCEFSSYRGPLMASHLRTCDRNKNQDNYPHLDYPNILVLEGGYKSFFDLQSHRCYPQKYVEMNDNNHKNACEKELTRFRRDLKRATSHGSFHFSSSNSASSHPKIPNRRTKTSTTFSRSKTQSLRPYGSLLDFSRSSLELDSIESRNESENESSTETEDDIKPPESMNFGFKFPLSKPSTASKSSINDFANHDSTPIPQKKKLSRAFTTYNM